MKPLLTLLALVFATPTFAKMSIEDVTPARAKELGIELKTNGAGPDATFVELTFKPDGPLKSFARVDLEIYDGQLHLFASLKEDHPTPGVTAVSFSADRSNLDKATLRIVTGLPGNYSGHDIHLKDFLAAPKADVEAQFLAAVRKAFDSRDAAALSAVTFWDRTSDSVKQSTEKTYTALVGEKDASFDFKIVAPDKQLLTAAEKYRTPLPITHQLNMIGRDPKDKKRILMILTFAVGEKDGNYVLLPCTPK